MEIALSITLIISSLLLVVLILLHRGKGGGLSSMFGGGVSSNLAGSSHREDHLEPVASRPDPSAPWKGRRVVEHVRRRGLLEPGRLVHRGEEPRPVHDPD